MTKPRCPKCATELNEEFGMLTCPGCGSVIFIDFDGQAQLAADDPSYDNSPSSAPAKPVVDEAVIESFSNYESMAPMAAEIAVEPSADGVFEAPLEQPAIHGDAGDEASQNEARAAANASLDISAYANSEASQAKEGPLTYTLHIEGLDSKELRESLREALSESRFAWDPGALMATIREGKLLLKAVEPVKASVLVNRLKRLPLKIWWEQNVVTDSTP